MIRSILCALALPGMPMAGAQEPIPVPLEPKRGALEGGFTNQEIAGDATHSYALQLESGDTVYVQLLPDVQISSRCCRPMAVRRLRQPPP